MKRDKPSGSRPSDLTTVHADAAAIDIGATMHMAAVGTDRSAEPVRSFGTFTADLCRLADWFVKQPSKGTLYRRAKGTPVRAEA